jgi:hypothetical protein
MVKVEIKDNLLREIINNSQGYTDPDLIAPEINNAVSEFLIKKDNIFTNVLSDFMINNEHGQESTINNVYDKLNQSNQNKLRHIEIINYNDKVSKEYLNIILVIIFVCIIIIPIAIANKNGLLPNSITLVCLVTLLFLASIFIFYKVIDIYMRDNIDFDKIRIPYDRNAEQLEKEGKLVKKKNPLTSLTLTCIGQDCCDGSMVYDYAKNKCLISENFDNYFEKRQANNNNDNRAIIESFGSCSKDLLVRRSLNLSNNMLFNIPLNTPSVNF